MDPVDFLAFREYLSPASGFQSAQARPFASVVSVVVSVCDVCLQCVCLTFKCLCLCLPVCF